jgi:serine protease
MLIAAIFVMPAGASAAQIVPGEVVVQYEDPATGKAPSPAEAAPVVLQVDNVQRALEQLRAKSNVAYAVPNLIAHAAGSASFMPNDPELGSLQWNFVGPYGVRAPQAWANAIAAGRAGGRGTIIAVIDSGVAYSNRSPFHRAPDFKTGQFKRGWDYVDGDPYPNDENGHGTHVAGTIAQATNNRKYFAGLAYGAKIMPIRALDRAGYGDSNAISKAVRYAVDHGADLINLSLEFDSGTRAKDIPELIAAFKYAKQRGVLVVAASGNEGAAQVSYPARATGVMAVGSTTQHGCVSEFSNGGSGLDIVAPGGGLDAEDTGESRCNPNSLNLREISQVGFRSEGTFSHVASLSRFTVQGMDGTSMATPHVVAAAALVIASGVIGSNPSPARIEQQLQETARDFGSPGSDRRYGAGLLDAAAATR